MALINLDVDGVALDFYTGLIGELKGRNIVIPDKDHECWREWNFLGLLPKGVRDAAYSILREQTFWTYLQPVEGAQEAVKALRDAGHKIHWVTSPWTSCKVGWDHARRYALERHFDHPDQNILEDLCIWRSKQWVWANAFIDDRPDTVQSWKDRHPDGLGIVFDSRFTRDLPIVSPHMTWTEDHLKWLLEELEGK